MVDKKRQEKGSVCEKSMQLMVNILKLSSFSLATTMNLGEKHEAKDGTKPFTSFFPSNSLTSKSKRSEAPFSKSYLMEEDAADNWNFSDYIERFHRKTKIAEENTDAKAGAYIRKFHQKNSRHFTLAGPTSLPLVLPPPPPPSSINK